MAPLTRDGIPSSESSVRLAQATEPIELFDAGELFGEPGDDGEKTIVTARPYELRPRFTGRRTALDTLKKSVEAMIAARSLAFAVIGPSPAWARAAWSASWSAPRKRRRRVGVERRRRRRHAVRRDRARARARFGIAPGEPEAESRDRIQAAVAEVAARAARAPRSRT